METMETNDTLRAAWNETCLRAGLPSISSDTSARIMAVLHVESGCTTAVAHSPKLRADLEYIQKRSRGNAALSTEERAWPEWARSLYMDAYNVKLTPVFV